MQQIYKRTPVPKCDLQLYWNRTSGWVFSWKFASYFQNTFSLEHLRLAASVTASREMSVTIQRRFLKKLICNFWRIPNKLLDRVLFCAWNLCFLCLLASGINSNTPRYKLISCQKVIITTLQLRQWHCCSSFIKVACMVSLKLVFTD